MIDIYCNNIKLPIVKSTLTINSKNNLFFDSLYLEYNNYPFLIIENQETIEALGSKHIMSYQRNKTYEVNVIRYNESFKGILKVNKYIQGARLCDLVFGSEILSISDVKINTLMPKFFLDSNLQQDYEAETTVFIDPTELIRELYSHQLKTFPDVDFQFPEVYAPTFFGKQKDRLDGEWEFYHLYLNNRTFNQFLEPPEIISISRINKSVKNYTSFHPMIYFVSVLKYIFKSIGWSVVYDRKHFSFLKEILICLNVNNNTTYGGGDIKISKKVDEVNSYFIDSSELGIGEYRFYYEINFSGKITTSFFNPYFYIEIYVLDANSNIVETIIKKEQKLIFDILNNQESFKFSEVLDFKITDPGHKVLFKIYHSLFIIDSSLSGLYEVNLRKSFKANLFHPTVDLNRYVPDWSVSETLNNFKNLLNLKFDFKEIEKKVVISYGEEFLKSSLNIVDLTHCKLEVFDNENLEDESFKIKYTNGDFIIFSNDKNSIDTKITEINTVFFTPKYRKVYHRIEKEELGNGVGLILNYPKSRFTTDEIDGKTLNLQGDKGLGSLFWKNWFKFKGNSSLLKLKGYISIKDLKEIEKYNKIFYDDIVFVVKEVRIKENNGFVETILEVLPKLF